MKIFIWSWLFIFPHGQTWGFLYGYYLKYIAWLLLNFFSMNTIKINGWKEYPYNITGNNIFSNVASASILEALAPAFHYIFLHFVSHPYQSLFIIFLFLWRRKPQTFTFILSSFFIELLERILQLPFLRRKRITQLDERSRTLNRKFYFEPKCVVYSL